MRTKTSHGRGGKDIGGPLIKSMAEQCKLDMQKFKDLVECPLSREEYEDILVNEEHIRL